jgi:hypothetical protein
MNLKESTMREEGFYWVKIDGDWTVGEYAGESFAPWTVIGSDESFEEAKLELIGDRLDPPLS